MDTPRNKIHQPSGHSLPHQTDTQNSPSHLEKFRQWVHPCGSLHLQPADRKPNLFRACVSSALTPWCLDYFYSNELVVVWCHLNFVLAGGNLLILSDFPYYRMLRLVYCLFIFKWCLENGCRERMIPSTVQASLSSCLPRLALHGPPQSSQQHCDAQLWWIL